MSWISSSSCLQSSPVSGDGANLHVGLRESMIAPVPSSGLCQQGESQHSPPLPGPRPGSPGRCSSVGWPDAIILAGPAEGAEERSLFFFPVLLLLCWARSTAASPRGGSKWWRRQQQRSGLGLVAGALCRKQNSSAQTKERAQGGRQGREQEAQGDQRQSARRGKKKKKEQRLLSSSRLSFSLTKERFREGTATAPAPRHPSRP